MRQYIPYAVLAAIIIAIFFVLSSGTNAKVKPDKNGDFKLRMNKIYLIVGWMALILLTGVNFILIQRMNFTSFQEDHVIFIADLLVLPVAILSIISYRRHNVVFNSDELTINTRNGNSYTFPWEDITDVEYNAFNSNIKIKTRNSGTLKVNQYLIGFKSFIEMLDSRTELINLELLKTRLRMD